jgi:hypothetical protein
MSQKRPGFAGRSIQDVQEKCFLRDLPCTCRGRWRYASGGLNADAGAVVLFQFRARIIASAIFLRDEKFARPIRGSAGVLCFDPSSFRTFEPLDVQAMRKTWPGFRAFGHAKQALNPTLYGKFKRRLRNVASPSARSSRPSTARASR